LLRNPRASDLRQRSTQGAFINNQIETTARELAQRQLEAYNRRDLESFVACYGPEVEVRRLGSHELLLCGQDALRESYGKLFAQSPALHCRLVHRTVVGAFVFDEEQVSGRNGSDDIRHVMAIYEIKGAAIANVWFAAPP
jgi:hypothetical protein